MKRYLVHIALLGVFFACDTTSSIDPPDDTHFLKFYGNEGNQKGIDAVVNADGTITLLGNTDSKDMGQQLYLVNIEANGTVIWEIEIGGANDEQAVDLELTSDGRLVLVANVLNAPGDRDILIMTLSSDGNVINSQTTGFTDGSGNTDEVAISVTQSTDGFLVAGSTSNLDLKPNDPGNSVADTRDALHLRYFDDLSPYPSTWRQAHGPGTFDECVKVIQVSPTQFYFFGYSNTQATDQNFYVLGLGVDGETNNADDFLPGTSSSNELLKSVIVSPIQSGEGYLLAGISQATGANADIFIVKLRKDLTFLASDKLFEKTLGINLGVPRDLALSAYASSNSGFFILVNENTAGVQNFYLTKIDNNGFEAWPDAITFGGEMDDSIGSVLELPDGSIGIIGTFSIGQDGETKMTFIKVNKEGKFLK